MKNRLINSILILMSGILFICQAKQATAQINNPETPINWPVAALLPGKAKASLNHGQMKLSNHLIEASWLVKNKHFKLVRFTDLKTNQSISFENISPFLFEKTSPDKIDADDFVVTSYPKVIILPSQSMGPRVADHISGKAFSVTLYHSASGMVIHWQAELRDGSNYIRQVYTISRAKQFKSDTISRIVLFRLPVPYSPENSLGSVPGSPYAIPGTNIIAGVEQPAYFAQPDSNNHQISELSMPTQLTLGAENTYEISTMIGSFPLQQRRRTFQYYIERERASKSRIYLHYNSWYDLGEDLSEKKLIKVAHDFKTELVQKRRIKLDGFVLDDGWDNPDIDLWSADREKFPGGFDTLQKALRSGAEVRLGLWVSPCGGYGGQEQRLNLVKKAHALPADATKFDLGYPGYYELFRQLCTGFMDKYKVNYFKWDNAAPYENNGRTFGNLKATTHFMRICQLAQELHKKDPELFINATVGTWPSPFWLNYVDCTWRMGGADVSWIGKGDLREKGMNYRDGEVYNMVVRRAPLYPLNSMMFHGVILGHKYQGKKTSEAGNNMTNEFRSYFALGTNLQELYLSTDMMNAKNWDDLAACIRWNKQHRKILLDSHWVSGDPNKSEPYCYAAWSNNKGVLCIRNPNDKPNSITIDISTAFELPAGAASNYKLKAAYQDERFKKIEAKAGKPLTITLQPFEVLVFNAKPE